MKEFNVDDVQYVMHKAKAYEAWQALKAILPKINLTNVDFTKPNPADLLKVIADVASTPEFGKIETMILQNTVANIGDKPYRIADKLNEHFAEYPHHVPTILKEGIELNFLGYLKNLI